MKKLMMMAMAATTMVGAAQAGEPVQLWKDGPYWAECNVGASKPEEYGYYFWWGDTIGYKRNASNDGWISVQDGTTTISFESSSSPANSTCDKDIATLTSEGYIDSTGNLVAAHDAATAHLGELWRMPTSAEIQALVDKCTREWITTNGVQGYLVKGKDDYASKSIFLPAAGYGNESRLVNHGSYGYYWSSTPNSSNSRSAWNIYTSQYSFTLGTNTRYVGQPVRPVYTPPPDYLTFTAEEEGSTVTFKWLSANWVSNSTDGVTWSNYDMGTTIPLAKVGDKVMFKGSGVKTGYDKYETSQNFSMAGKIAASGDVGTLTDGKGGADVKLTDKCYSEMFCDCTSLTAAPALPATMLNDSCYHYMFNGCTSLTAAPELSVTTLKDYCYSGIFGDCTALKVNQEGPGTEWSIPAEAQEANRWNSYMFAGNLGTVPYEPSIGVTYYVVPTVAFKPIEVENATWEIIEDNQVMTLRDRVHTNGTIKVRYTAKDGLAFADGSYVKTVLVGKADADPFAPTGYAPAAPTEWTQATASTTVDIDTRTDKLYFDADDILPVWADFDATVTATNTSMVAETKKIADCSSTTNWYGWKPAYLGKYILTKDGYAPTTGEPITETADITYTTPVYVSTNAALDVEGATWALTDAGGSPITEMDEEGRFKVPTNSQLKVVYTVTKDGYYFKDGTKTYEAAFTATGAEYFGAATMIGDNKPKAGDIGQPKVQLGIVAQRYPWDGKLDVQYKALYTPEGVYALEVKVKVEGEERTQTFPDVKSGISTVVYDVKADFGEVKTKNCKVKAKLVTK